MSVKKPDTPLPNAEMPPHWLKRMVKSIFRRFGLDIVRHQPTTAKPLNILDLVVRTVHAGRDDFFFLQVGANDGVRHDPLHALVRELHLRGLLVEPLPDLFDELRRNYTGEPQLLFENAAVSAGAGNMELARFHTDAPVHDDLHGLASADIARMERFARRHGLTRYLERVTVPALTFGELLAKHGLSRIDLLVLDVEGHEWELLEAAFEAGLRPRIVFLEFLHLTPRERWQAEKSLAAHGYAIAYTGIDIIGMTDPE